jgi:hypothetical protein
MMKPVKYSFLLMLVILAAGLGSAQQISEEASVINIEVPVRVFSGGRLVTDLSLDDFEVFEDGKPQKLEAVYFVQRNSVERRAENRRFTPNTNRNFFLFFEVGSYDAKMGEALDYFVDGVFMPGDALAVVTPMKTYRLKPRALEARTRGDISGQIKGLIRRDATMGSNEYNSILSDLEDMARSLLVAMSELFYVQSDKLMVDEPSLMTYKGLSVDDILTKYLATIRRLENIRAIDETRILEFPNILKKETGQKHVFIFYEREFIPRINPRMLDLYTEMFQDRPDIQQKLSEVFEFYKRDLPYDVDRLQEAYADASIAIHFLMFAKPARTTPEIQYKEQSDDIFAMFKQMSEATGGVTTVSENPTFLFRTAVEASESYYLLYYTPRPYIRDGKFRRITVRTKRPGLKLSHRIGYVAD